MQISRSVPGPRQSLSRHFPRTAQLHKEPAALSPPNATVPTRIQQFPRILRIMTIGTTSIFFSWGLRASDAAREVILAGRTCVPARESRRPRPSGGGVRAPPLPRISCCSGSKCLWVPLVCPRSECLGTRCQHGGSPHAGEARPGAPGRAWWVLDAGGPGPLPYNSAGERRSLVPRRS